jgi:phosphoribosylaminoimidazole (AIR) synthetase
MYQVFNMGIDMAVMVAPNDAGAIGKELHVRTLGGS